MLISNVICETPSFLRIIYFIELVRKLFFIVLPIGLTIMIIFKAYKNIINTNNEVKAEVLSAGKRIAAVIIIIFVPIIVDLIMNFTGLETRDAYKTCRENATVEKIEYFRGIEEKVDKVRELINVVKRMPTVENLAKAEQAVSNLYGVANGSIIEDLEYSLATIRTSITMTNAEFNCKISGGTYNGSECEHKSPGNSSSLNGNSGGMVHYKFQNTDYFVVNTSLKVEDYIQHVQQKRICQAQANGGVYWDQCLCFAEEHVHALLTGDTHKSPSQINEYYYSGIFNNYSDDNKRNVLNLVYSELVNNKPVILHVNGNKAGTSRHYVAVIGFKSSVKSAEDLQDDDILIIDSYDGQLEQLHFKGTSRFLTTGAECKKPDYSGYQVYFVK